MKRLLCQITPVMPGPDSYRVVQPAKSSASSFRQPHIFPCPLSYRTLQTKMIDKTTL
jgi:hypothetical protein